MNDVTVVTSVTYPSPESLALVADVQYHEPYLSAALNRKFRGIVDPGFYAGFLPKPGGGMNLLITSVDGDKTAGAASVDIGEFYQVTIQQRKDISLALSAGKKYAIVLKGRYLLGEDTYQVNTASHIHAAEFVARTYTDSYQLGDGELLVCTVNIPAGVSTITQEMIDTSERINRTIGIDISDSVTSTRSDVAASSLAVKKAYDLAKSKYTAQDASTTQKGLVQLSSATNSTSEVLAATPKAVKAAYDLANGKYTAQDATTTQKGIVQLSSDTNSTSETLAATPKAVKAAYDLAAGKAPSSHTHPWNQITGVPTASLTAKGITQLSSATNSTSETLAATPKAVKAVMDETNKKAPLNSPALTGTPTTPTAPQGTNSTQIASTAFVMAAIAALVDSSPDALNTLNELAAALGNDPNFATTMTNALAGKQPKDATLTALAELATSADKLPYFTGADRAALTALTSVGRAILGKTSTQGVLDYLGLSNLLHTGDGRFLAGTFVSDAIDRTSIGARAATGCQFMRAHQAPDAPDQASYWQIITLSEVVSPTTVVDVLAVSGNNVLFGHGTGAGITSWRHVAMLEGGAFTGGISAPNMRGDTLVTVGDGTGGMAKGDVDGAGFNGNNLNIKSWNGIGFQNSEDLAIRAYISTRLGVIAAAENLQAGNAIFNKNGDVYGDIWGTGSGPGWLSAYIAGRPLRQYITMVGVYQNDKTKPFMLHDDGSGVFLATTDMLSGYVQSIRFGAVEHGNLYRSPGFADQLGYVITGVENGDSNDTPDRIQRRLLQLKVNGQWYTVGT
ncbi:tail fiber protein [Salmonella enterica subsp. enterica serovar Indiana]|nr:tail fiber protein [Salmonella enterica subsp. enterica serovar Indiana]